MGRPRASFEFSFDAPPEAVWPFISDTERGNALAGMPPVRYEEARDAEGRTRLFGTYRELVTFRYEERPFTWEYARWHRSERVFSKGPLRHQEVIVHLEPEGEGGCRLRWEIVVEPAAWAPSFIVAFLLRNQFVPRYQRLMARIAEVLATGDDAGSPLAGGESAALERPPNPADAAARARIAEAAERTRERLTSPGLASLEQASTRQASPGPASPWLDRLAADIAERPSGDLHRLRPRAVARRWGAPVAEVLDLMLAATDVGLLVMRWDVLCPHCRGDRQNLENLGDVAAEAYCDACDLAFDVDLSRNLEVVFAPHPAVRATEPERFCLAGPGANAHVFVQRKLEADATLSIEVDLPPGRYRVRAGGSSAYRWLRVVAGAEEAPETWSLVVLADDMEGEDLECAPGHPVRLRVENRTDQERVLVVETAEWIQDVLSAGELVVTQRFRDLFDSQVLAPGITLQVERVVILFTDLVGSTAMYRRLGDATAFRYVWSHFDALRPVIAAHGGAIVKTIGDAVMAVFIEPSAAIRAAVELHAVLDAHDAEAGFVPPVGLKIGLASGPAYAVNLNGLMDYFGSTVNLAARIQAESEGGDVMVPADLSDEVARVVGSAWRAEPVEVVAKGFERPVPALRLRPSGESARGEASIGGVSRLPN